MPSRLDENKVAARYAKALFDSASESGTADEVFESLNTVQSLFNSVPELLTFLGNPAISRSDKEDILKNQISKNLHPMVATLLQLMLENERIGAFQYLLERYQDLLNEKNNVTTAEVITAVELSSKLEKKLQKTLESLFGFDQVNLHKRVDPGILGGVMVKIQDKVIDGTFVGKLESLRKQIAR